MTNDDELIFFKDEEEKKDETSNIKPWKILIVDDEADVHSLTKMVLTGYSFENRPLDITSVYSGVEAIEYLKKESDIAIILLDVVMETEDAGLRCVKSIREDLKNHESRIILRTGQPGQAPEQQVIVNYDINDYKAKTELTASKLFTAITASLRSYQYIQTINQNKIGLETIISASSFLFELQSFSLFAKGILKQLTSILSLDDDSLYINSSSLSAFKEPGTPNYSILAGTGNYAGHEREGINNVVSESVYKKLLNAANKQESIFNDNTYTGYFETKKGEHTLLFLQWQRPLTAMDKELIRVYALNVAAAFENISRNNDLAESQRKIITTLSQLIDEISRDNTNHVTNVTDISCFIAEELEIPEEEIYHIKMAAPMHDIGQISISQEILKKPGKLTEEEYEIMKLHTVKGYEIFKDSQDPVMITAKNISYQHHEKWDGTGYPRGLKGEQIHIYGRIVAIADVYDALTTKKQYREKWSHEKAVQYIEEERGKHFDPVLVDIFLKNHDKIRGIKDNTLS
ncbi:response regulator [Thiospirochaeta perfilievii]|uniref:Response regulator n=1 Tax=Thiospirochaeta perfilievii TaxID=252967 RepID=A0A5C1QEB6_9SPIO|nr:response regulator [Thiospirochaeta perfilievii]QEN05400.1 response regulator [Thiospirochaeta perfilievii]